jgi:transposase
LGNQLFGCQKDIAVGIKSIDKKLKYHRLTHSIQEVPKYPGKGRPKKDAVAEKIEYRVKTIFVQNEEAITNLKKTKGRFILATNQLDQKKLADHDVLSTYKAQSGTESGFKFIKDGAFEIDSIFLKTPGRISALMMVMTLCLMVYSFSQYFFRQKLQESNDSIRSQSGQETNKPSMKWVYKLFQGVHVLKIKIGDTVQELVLNLREELRKIVMYFGSVACRIYGVELSSIESS